MLRPSPSRRDRARSAAAAGVVVLAVALTGGVLAARAPGADPGQVARGPQAPEPDAEVLVEGITQRAVSTLTPLRLAPGIVPPTNRWFSALVFGQEGPRPVFPRPLSFALTGSGFSVGVPEPVTTADAITSRHVPAVTVDVGAASARVSGYDDASVTIDLLDAGGRTTGQVVVVQGTPYVSLRAVVPLSVTTDAPFTGPGAGAERTAQVAGRTWALVAPDAAGQATTLRLDAGAVATWYPVPGDADDRDRVALAEAARDPVVATRVTSQLDDATRVAVTTLDYRTADGGRTVFATMPHHRRGEQPRREGCGLGTFPSVYGTLELCTGPRLVSWAPLQRPAGALDLSDLTEVERSAVLERLVADVAATPEFPRDTYFGGKAMYRAATLVVLGEQLGADDVVAPLRRRTAAALREWAQPDGCDRRPDACFLYDPVLRGVVGLQPSFGSEEFNDHHFHYGYHLSAAGLLVAEDAALRSDIGPVMDLLALDIAAPAADRWFPRLRHFDGYAGHSWASGGSPFDNGSNAESSSEALNAWNGTGLWAAATGRAALADQAAWLLSTEAASARAYWTDLDRSDPVHAGYAHSVVGINWGAKRDHATFFSTEPSAVLGIQLVPMGPHGATGSTDPERIRAMVAEAAPGGFDVPFGDYLLMYLSLAGPDDARRAWREALDHQAVDDGNSGAYLLAFIAAQPGRQG